MRRTSWASIVSGSAGPAATPQRSGFLSSHLSQQPSGALQEQESHSSRQSNFTSIRDSAQGLRPTQFDQADRRQALNSQVPFPDLRTDVIAAMMGQHNPDFFVPSYLGHSRYIKKLKEKHKAKASAHNDGRKRSSLGGSLSASHSNVNLHTIVPSHRGMTHEVIERPFQFPDPSDIPDLPSRWNQSDKFAGIDVTHDGLEAKFNGHPKTMDEGAAVRADHPMPRQCGVYYFEVAILSKSKDNSIAVGFSTSKVTLNRMPGWEPESWAYHADDGNIFSQTAQPKHYGPKSGQGDIIGCGVNFHSGTAFFTRNGHHMGTAFREVKADQIFPSVGFKSKGESIRVNFGQAPFVYGIDHFVDAIQLTIYQEVRKTDISKLHDTKREMPLLEELVAQYLAHDGYVETAKAFTEEVRHSSNLLQPSNTTSEMEEYQEDHDAAHRQQIRAAILEGDVDNALKLTRAYYPSVLENNENIYFKLRCRKFIEMIRACNDLQNSNKGLFSSADTSLNGHSDADHEVLDGGMEIDTGDEMPSSSEVAVDDSGTDMEVEHGISDDAYAEHAALLSSALAYGQELQAEFKDDPRREVKQALEETFALIAYPDARESSLAPLLEIRGRIPVAEELNSAILVSLGKSSCAVLERLFQQTEVMVDKMATDGDAASLINVKKDYLRSRKRSGRINHSELAWDVDPLEVVRLPKGSEL